MPLLDGINAVLWHDYVLFAVLATGVIFTVWSRFCQYRGLTCGVGSRHAGGVGSRRAKRDTGGVARAGGPRREMTP